MTREDLELIKKMVSIEGLAIHITNENLKDTKFMKEVHSVLSSKEPGYGLKRVTTDEQ